MLKFHCCGSTLTSLAAFCPAAPQCLSGEQSTEHGLVCQVKLKLGGRVGCSRGLVRPNWCWIVDTWEREKPIKSTIKNNKAKFQRVLVISADVTAASSGDVQSLVVQAGKMAENSDLLGYRDGKLPKHKLCFLFSSFFFLLPLRYFETCLPSNDIISTACSVWNAEIVSAVGMCRIKRLNFLSSYFACPSPCCFRPASSLLCCSYSFMP